MIDIKSQIIKPALNLEDLKVVASAEGWKLTDLHSLGFFLNRNFKYRRAIKITEQSGSDLTDYQVLIELNSTNFDFSHAQTNGEDIRFADTDGNLLSYWIEEWDSVNKKAKVWVKVPSIPANSSVEIWMYYGNPRLEDASDGEATFEFFDDFGEEAVKFGLINSVESQTSKLQEAVDDFNEWEADFVIEIGDFIDSESEDDALSDLEAVENIYSDLTMSRYYGFGNHDLDWLTKQQFMNNTAMSQKYYSFDCGDFHFIVLDPMYDESGNDVEDCHDTIGSDCPFQNTIYVSDEEKTWLENDLANTSKKTIVFMETHFEGNYAIGNAAEIRSVLENSGKVIATFSGNSGQNDKITINGIDHYRMRAMDEASPNAYAKIYVYKDGSIYIKGVGEQASWGSPPSLSDKWKGDRSYADVSDGILLYNGGGAWHGIHSENEYSPTIAVRARAKLGTSGNGYFGLRKSDTSNGRSIVELYHGVTARLNTRDDSGNSENTDNQFSLGEWHVFDICKISGETVKFYVDGELKATHTTVGTLGCPAAVRSADGDVFIDYFCIRKYTEPEPSVSIGEEETA